MSLATEDLHSLIGAGSLTITDLMVGSMSWTREDPHREIGAVPVAGDLHNKIRVVSLIKGDLHSIIAEVLLGNLQCMTGDPRARKHVGTSTGTEIGETGAAGVRGAKGVKEGGQEVEKVA